MGGLVDGSGGSEAGVIDWFWVAKQKAKSYERKKVSSQQETYQ